MRSEEAAYLDARVKLAMAQVHLGIDWRAAAETAGDGLHDVVLLAAQSLSEEIPWPLRCLSSLRKRSSRYRK